ncbi:glycosyltransferase family 4 protein [Candidatus Uhrbacteria bacterium]|nr:glycosyltransferase family 4 protein [Candidatus Uhrbacteria bacterium]
MTIGIDIRPLLEGGGGVWEYCRSIVDGLLSIPSDHQFVLFSNSFKKKTNRDLPRWSLRATIADFSYPNKLFNARLLALRSPHFDILIREKTGLRIDLFFAPNSNFISLSNRTKLVTTAHDLSFAITPDRLSVKDRLWHRFVSPAELFSRSERVIAVSHSTRRDLETLYRVPPEKIAVTYLAARTSGFDAAMPSREALGLPARYLFGLGAGSRKNSEGLIEAFSILVRMLSACSLFLVLAGANRHDIARLSRHAHRRGIADRVLIGGRVPSSHLLAYYAYSEMFVYPSFTEGFGIPPLEAASAGTPVIASQGGSIGEVMGEAACLVDPYSPQQIANQMRMLLEDGQARKHYIEAGRRRAMEFSWKTCAEQTLSILEGTPSR